MKRPGTAMPSSEATRPKLQRSIPEETVLYKLARTIPILSLLAVGATLVACAHRAAGPGGAGGGAGSFAMPVSAAPLRRGEISTYFTITGSVQPMQAGSLSSVVPGNVLSVNAQIGQRVKAGQVLVQIDDSTLRAQEAQAAANLAQIRANNLGGSTTAQSNLASAKVAFDTAAVNLSRNETLYHQGYVSKSAVDQAQQQAASAQAAYRAAQVAQQNASLDPSNNSAAVAALKSAEAAVQTIGAQIAQTTVRAPFDGVVTVRNVDPGSLASPGTVLMEVSQLDPVFVDAGIAGDNLTHVRVGTPVAITVDQIPGRTWHTRVGYLNLASAPGTSIYQARIPVANPDLVLRGGMVASATFVQASKTGVLIAPRAAVFQTDAGYSMFVIDQGKAKVLPVEVGLSNDREMEVSGAGLKPGVQAILNHSVTLQPGMPVQPLPAQAQAHAGGY